MTVTHENSPEWYITSPLTVEGFFQEQIRLGNTDYQVTAHAPSWIANPSITEEATHRLETDRRIWLREYCAIPQASVLAALDADAVERAFLPRFERDAVQARRVLVLDPSSGRSDAWTWAVVGWNVPDWFVRHRDGSVVMAPWHEPLEKSSPPSWAPYLSFDLIDGIEGAFWKTVHGDEIVDRVAALAHSLDIRTVVSDQREALMLESAFSRRRLRYAVQDWTATSKPEAVARLRRVLAEGRDPIRPARRNASTACRPRGARHAERSVHVRRARQHARRLRRVDVDDAAGRLGRRFGAVTHQERSSARHGPAAHRSVLIHRQPREGRSMAEETTTAAVQYALHRQVWSALKAAYAGETDDVLDNATSEILGAGAAMIDAQGKVHFTPAVAKIAPPSRSHRDIRGTNEEATPRP